MFNEFDPIQEEMDHSVAAAEAVEATEREEEAAEMPADESTEAEDSAETETSGAEEGRSDSEEAERSAVEDNQAEDPEAEAAEEPTEEETGQEEAVQEKSKKSRGQRQKATAPKEEQSQTQGQSRNRIWYIDPEDRFNRQQDENRETEIGLYRSMKAKVYLVGEIKTVLPPDRLAEAQARLPYGNYTVVIPADELIPPEKNYNGMEPAEYRERQLNRRLGAEIDYIITGIDEAAHVAVGSRLMAMKLKCAQNWLRTNDKGLYILEEGDLVEARVVAVDRDEITVESFGVETTIRANQLSYDRISNAKEKFYPGMKVLTRVTRIDRRDPEDVHIELSVKQAMTNAKPNKIKKYERGARCAGIVSNYAKVGIFVSLEDGIDCLCSFARDFSPAVGSQVIVRITKTDVEKGRIWGRIEV